MGARTEYFCDLCENPRPLGRLTKFVLDGATTAVLMRVVAGLGDIHVCDQCVATVSKVQEPPKKAVTTCQKTESCWLDADHDDECEPLL